MHLQLISLFPEFARAVVDYGVVGRAVGRGLVSLGCLNPRDFADDVHRTVDDRPYGGGPGMVMKYAPLAAAVATARKGAPDGTPVVCLSPQGQVFDQALARKLSAMPGLILVAGRYEGIDERFIEAEVDLELSLGDFVLSGGEIAAMAVIDAVVRLLPGVLGDEESAVQESFESGLLDHPHYTRPEVIGDMAVPEVLLSGDHARIAKWRAKQALGRSFERRPELLKRTKLDVEQERMLDEYLTEQGRTSAEG